MGVVLEEEVVEGPIDGLRGIPPHVQRERECEFEFEIF
jgi:hypothetical protein